MVSVVIGMLAALVAPAIGVQRHQLAAPRDRNHGAGTPPRIDIGLQRLADPRQPLAGEADLCRFCARQGIVSERAGAGCGEA